MSATDQRQNVLNRSSKTLAPYACGVHTVRKDDLRVYFKDHAGTARCIDVSESIGEQIQKLEQLVSVCGSTGMLPAGYFATTMDAATAGIVEIVTSELLLGAGTAAEVQDKILRAQLREIRVEGPGMSTPTRDTAVPLENNHTGTLILVLPFQHSGGEATFQYHKFDAASELRKRGQAHPDAPPAVAYLAFHDSVAYTMASIDSGYRIALVYDLLLAAPAGAPPPSMQILNAAELACETSLRALLSMPSWFPNGGLLGFGLEYTYPDAASINTVTASLKGCDARLRDAARRVGLESRVGYLYDVVEYSLKAGYGQKDILVPHVADLSGCFGAIRARERLSSIGRVLGRVKADGSLDERRSGRDEYHGDDAKRSLEDGMVGVHWVTPQSFQQNTVKTRLFRNETVTCEAQIFVEIPPAEDHLRSVLTEI